MAAHQIYLRKSQERLLQEESDRLGICVNDLIKIRIEKAEIAQETLENFQQTLTKLAERIDCFELVLLQLIKAQAVPKEAASIAEYLKQR